MTQLMVANVGSYPRIGDEKDQQRHKRALAHLQKGELSRHAFRDVEHSVIQEVIREQIDLGVEEVTDGLVGWNDPISHFCRKLSNVSLTGLARYLNLNFYYRIPVITGSPKSKGPILLPEFQYAQSVSNRPVRMVLTGPYTLAQHTTSTKKPFNTVPGRMKFFAELLTQEINTLAAAGAKSIQINEPSLARNPDALKTYPKILEEMTANQPGILISLALHYTSVEKILDSVLNLPIVGLNLDITQDSPKIIEKIINSPAPKIIGLGVVSALNTRMESMDPILKMLQNLANRKNSPLIYITPAGGLEHLPRPNAREKLALLSQIQKEFIIRTGMKKNG